MALPIRNIISITKEVEKQLVSFIAANSSILRQMEALDDETQKKDSSVDIWRTASHFYHSINEAEDHMMLLIVIVSYSVHYRMIKSWVFEMK